MTEWPKKTLLTIQMMTTPQFKLLCATARKCRDKGWPIDPFTFGLLGREPTKSEWTDLIETTTRMRRNDYMREWRALQRKKEVQLARRRIKQRERQARARMARRVEGGLL